MPQNLQCKSNQAKESKVNGGFWVEIADIF
jgi:hypothetical protein